MALSPIGRKALLEYGAQVRVATRLDLSTAFVSAVVNGELIPKSRSGWKNYRRVQNAIAKELGMNVQDAFSQSERGELELLAAS